MSSLTGLTVVVARRDPWISADPALESVAGLAQAFVIDAPTDLASCAECSPPGRWTGPTTGALGWVVAEALERVPSGWLLLLDVDERVSEELAAEIGKRLSSNPREGGFRLRRLRRFLGRDLRATRGPESAGLRLVKVSGACPDPGGDGFVAAEASLVGHLDAPLVHDAFANLEVCMSRLDHEAGLQARLLAGAGGSTSLRGVVLGPVKAFLSRWFGAASVVDGTLGLIQAAFEGAFDVVRTAKLWELGMPARLRRVPSLPEPPP